MREPSGDVTQLLRKARTGDSEALHDLAPLIYNELHRIAAAQMRGERPGHTLQPTALVNEAFLRLVEQDRADWRDRGHFFGVASRMMRRVLVDHARGKLAGKRGAGEAPLNIDWIEVSDRPEKLEQILFVDEALDRLARFDPRQSEVVELHYFGGMSLPETAKALGVSDRTVDGDWSMAKAWLRREMSGGSGP